MSFFNSHPNLNALGSDTSDSAVCISVCLTSLFPCTRNSQNTVGVCNQIILHYISSRLVTILKVIDAPLQVSHILGLSVSKFFNFGFQISLLFAPEMSTRFFRLSTWLWFGSCNYCILHRFLGSKKLEHSSSNHGLCCFTSYKPRLYLAEVFIFSLMFSQALFMSSLSLKYSKAANLFENSVWHVGLI